MSASDEGTLPSEARCLNTPEIVHSQAQVNTGRLGLDAEGSKQINSQELDSEGGLMPPGGLEVPAYVIHPADVPLISRVAGLLQLSVVEYAQLAPHLHASSYLRMEKKNTQAFSRDGAE